MKKNQRYAKNRKRLAKKCPVKIGNEYEVDIIETIPDGTGIARIKGFLILVENTKIGDHIRVKITKTDFINAEGKII